MEFYLASNRVRHLGTRWRSPVSKRSPQSPARETVSRSSELHETVQSTLFITLMYLHSSIAYGLYGMRIDWPTQLMVAYDRAVHKMEAVERRHRGR
jgi:hypothetical protein